MDSGVIKYLIDANAVRELSIEVLQNKKNNNRILTVIQEVKDELPNIQHKLDELNSEALSPEAFSMMKSILMKPVVRAVMDYPQNKGAADVALLAYALTADVNGMFKDKVIIVTNDVGLQDAAGELDIDYISTEEFMQI